MFQKVPVIEEVYTYEMKITFIYRNDVVANFTKTFSKNPSVFQKNSGNEKFNA